MGVCQNVGRQIQSLARCCAHRGDFSCWGGRGLKMWLNGRSHLKAGLERFLLILNRCGIPTGAIL